MSQPHEECQPCQQRDRWRHRRVTVEQGPLEWAGKAGQPDGSVLGAVHLLDWPYGLDESDPVSTWGSKGS